MTLWTYPLVLAPAPIPGRTSPSRGSRVPVGDPPFHIYPHPMVMTWAGIKGYRATIPGFLEEGLSKTKPAWPALQAGSGKGGQGAKGLAQGSLGMAFTVCPRATRSALPGPIFSSGKQRFELAQGCSGVG